jgi:hypothetical protein
MRKPLNKDYLMNDTPPKSINEEQKCQKKKKIGRFQIFPRKQPVSKNLSKISLPIKRETYEEEDDLIVDCEPFVQKR